jgi:hypothetical protein
VKAYEYYTLTPWNDSYLTAQKTFEDLRRLVEPSDSDLDSYFGEGVTDTTKVKKQALIDLLKKPENRQNGKLQPEDFDLLRLVYQKPLWDMGKDLADKLMTGDEMKYMTTPVTLGTGELTELNALIKNRTRPYAIRFSPLRLRQIHENMQLQRIRDIKITAVKCSKLGEQMPDSITFKFTLVGKSVVRSDNRLFAFDPDMKRGKNREESPVGVTFGTLGRGKDSTPERGNPGVNVLKGKALEPISDTPDNVATSQESLLKTLMNDSQYDYTTAQRGTHNQLIKLSRLRPGIFSDFLLEVTFLPAGSTVEFNEISLVIDLETANAGRNAMFVSVDNNLDLEIPITASIGDHSGRDGGFRQYVGLYDQVQKLRFTVPSTFGLYKHVGWLQDGKKPGKPISAASGAADRIVVANTAYLVYTDEGAFALTLPPTPKPGDAIKFADAKGTFGTNNLSINGNGHNITERVINADLSVATYKAATNGDEFELTFVDNRTGWRRNNKSNTFDAAASGYITALYEEERPSR